MNLNFVDRFVAAALDVQGTPYIWGGKGVYAWSPVKPVAMQEHADCPVGFDCAGLVTYASLKAGGKDLTMTWNAQTMFNFLPDAELNVRAHLALYGKGPTVVSHVAIVLGDHKPLLLLQAAGGDQTTINYTEAIKRGACVSLGFGGRQDLLGFRSIAALESPRT